MRAILILPIALLAACTVAAPSPPDEGAADAAVPPDINPGDLAIVPDFVVPPIGRGFVDVTPSPIFRISTTTDPDTGIVPQMAAALLGDLDGDGKDEVILSPAWQAPSPPPLVYRYDGAGGLLLSPITLPASVSVRAAADMDGDGCVDVVLDGPGVLWSDCRGGYSGPVWLDRFTGGANALALADLDGDGWLDILQVRDPGFVPGRDTIPYRYDGSRSFSARPDLLAQTEAGYTDSLGIMLLDGTETLFLAASPQAQGQSMPPRFYRKSGVAWVPADPLPAGPSKDRLLSGSPMGAASCDLDFDGEMDLAVALNPDTVFWSGGSGGMPWIDRSWVTGISRLPVAPGHVFPPMGWAFGCFDIDGDGKLDLVEAYGNDASGFLLKTNDSGPQPIKAWTFRRGSWLAEDLSPLVGLGRMGQWHSLSVGDIDGDGAPDFAIGAWGESPRVYLNRTGTPTTSIRIRSRHGQPAYGVRVESGLHRFDASAISPLVHSDAAAFVTDKSRLSTITFSDGQQVDVMNVPGSTATARQK